MRPGLMLPVLLASMLLSGCAGYRVGPTNGVTAGSRSIQVNLFENKTLEPRLTEAVGISLRRLLQQDGTYKLDTQNGGDIVVSGALLTYERFGLSFQPRDILSVRDFEIRIRAHVVAIDRTSGKTVLDRDVSGRTTLRPGADFSSAERQAVPLLAEDLSKNITSLLVDGSW
jgi:hypothetical protein